jgi:transcriptional regulator with XRE-family HTH domain
VPRTDKSEQIRLGQWIRSQRLRAGMTQAQLAEKLDISYQVVQRMEKGLARITVQRMNLLGTIFDILPGDLMNDFSMVMAGEDPHPLRDTAPLSEEEQILLAAFHRIQDKSLRRTVVELVAKIGRN